MKNLILIAIQGAGKGTLAKSLVEEFGYAHISTGDLLRERTLKQDELGCKIKSIIDNGELVSDDIILKAIEDKITSKDCLNGYILDGFPRNIEQAVQYDKLLEKLNLEKGIVLNLVIPEDLLFNRITGRRMCKKCGSIYNIYSNELQLLPKTEGICNKCGGELYKREDDNEEAMKKRISTYYSLTEPLIEYYKKQGILYEIDSRESNIAKKSAIEIIKKEEI